MLEYIGPFDEEYYMVIIDGYKIPHIKARKSNGMWTIVLERCSLAIDCEDEIELARWLHFCANAMAVAAGYTSFGAQAEPANLYRMRMISLAQAEILPKS